MLGFLPAALRAIAVERDVQKCSWHFLSNLGGFTPSHDIPNKRNRLYGFVIADCGARALLRGRITLGFLPSALRAVAVRHDVQKCSWHFCRTWEVLTPSHDIPNKRKRL
ncbi:hypothetical protein, partial [Bowmanella denitrificans]|uniref:hypothetical protein n=1 Tax=Bowmanella denitrificans TaxID=366582 RepID=UPI0031D55BA4